MNKREAKRTACWRAAILLRSFEECGADAYHLYEGESAGGTYTPDDLRLQEADERRAEREA